MTRPLEISVGEFYHIYNRGTDKRSVFLTRYDYERFITLLYLSNSSEPVRIDTRKKSLSDLLKTPRKETLVDIGAFCLMPNHFHLLLHEKTENGISRFIQKLNTAYTMYFNKKNDRSGALFQGVFKASHINSNEYLLHVSAYVNLNNRVHKIDNSLSWNSWNEYIGEKPSDFCKKDIILGQFDNKDEYKKFAESSLVDILERKGNEKDVENLLLE